MKTWAFGLASQAQAKNGKITLENIVEEFYDHFKNLYGSELNATTDINENNENIYTIYK